MKTIETLRAEIQQTDIELIKHLAKRFKLCLEIGALKSAHGKEITDQKQEHKQFKLYEQLAKEHEVAPELIEQIFKLIISQSKSLQK